MKEYEIKEVTPEPSTSTSNPFNDKDMRDRAEKPIKPVISLSMIVVDDIGIVGIGVVSIVDKLTCKLD